MQQFAEQIAEADPEGDTMREQGQWVRNVLAPRFRHLPPVGLLPRAAGVPRRGESYQDHFFPDTYTCTVAPIPQEQLELMLRDSAALAPYDLSQADQVQIWLPVPQAWYESDLLEVERVDALFEQRIGEFLLCRAEGLVRRALLRDCAKAIGKAISGEPADFPQRDPQALPDEDRLPFRSHRVLQSPRLDSAQERTRFAFRQEGESFIVRAEDALTLHVWIDPVDPPSGFEIRFQDVEDGENAFSLRFAWGAPIRIDPEGTSRSMGEVPAGGEWVRLSLPVLGTRQESITLQGMAVLVEGGWLAFGHVGTRGAETEAENVWLGSTLPEGARASVSPEGSWCWVPTEVFASLPHLLNLEAIEEESYGTSSVSNLSGDTREVTALAELRARLIDETPIDRDAVSVETWPSRFVIPDNLKSRLSYNKKSKLLSIKGVMSKAERNELLSLLPAQSEDDQRALRAAIEDLHKRSQDNTTIHLLETKGLLALIRFLEEKVAEADDKLDFGFLTVRTDMYRLRQHVLAQADASRLSISPTLAEIAKRESAAATENDLSAYFEAAQRQLIQPLSEEVKMELKTTLSGVLARDAALKEAVAQGLAAVEGPAPGSLTGGGPPASRSGQQAGISSAAAQALGGATPIGATTGPILNPLQPSQADVLGQAPIIGRVPDTVSVAERLQQPAAIETLDYSLKGRKTIVDNLAQISLFKDLPVPGSLKHLTFGQIQAKGGLEFDEDEDEDGDEDDGDDAKAEIFYFSRAVRALDRAVAALRLGEGRTHQYRETIHLCRTTLAKLIVQRTRLNQRLRVVDTELAEARHDVAVGRALLAVEEDRVERINQRRDQILAEHVTYLAYQRPRTADLLEPPPWRSLDPGLMADPVPPCLSDDHPVPKELQAMTNLLREAPLEWFAGLGLERVDAIESLVALMSNARRQVSLALEPPHAITTGTTPIASTIQQIYAQNHQQLQQKRLQIEQVDLQAFAAQSWQESRRQAQQVLSLADLLTAGHLQASLSNDSTERLRTLTRVAACLLARFEAVAPALRLEWAERLSQFDEPVSLRTLTNLPRWGAIAYSDRRELQTLVDWLFQQFHPERADAIAYVNDLVRLCLLLASHAPVHRIITGRVLRPVTVSPGEWVQIGIDPAEVRIGMPVLVTSDADAVVAQGIVVDLSGMVASTHITKTSQPVVSLSETNQVQVLRKDLL